MKPRFAFELEVPAAKLVFGRFVMFALLAADALAQIRHAPRYGSGFNVAQLPGLDALGPGRLAYGLGELVLAYAFVLIACGVATRWLVPVAAVIYNWLYFGSQLDSYQHHYLVAMLLIVACFVPWQRRVALDQPVRSWALRLILVELAIVYLWAAISKLDPLWLNGTALSGQLHGSLRALIDATIGLHAVAILVPLTELALVWVWARPAWPYLAPLGIAFHLGIVWTGLEIGLFAWLMIAFYLFIVPDRIYLVAVRGLAPVRARATELAAWLERRRWIVLAVAVAGGLACAIACHLPGSLGVAIVATVAVTGVALAAALRGKRLVALALAHLLALATWLAIDRTTPIARDYYKFWGGTARRLNDPAAAETAYRRLTELAPDDAPAHYYLGLLLLAHDDTTGLDELHAAQRLDRAHARGYIAEARWLAAHDRLAEAVAAAQAAVAAEPNDAEARNLVTTLLARRHVR